MGIRPEVSGAYAKGVMLEHEYDDFKTKLVVQMPGFHFLVADEDGHRAVNPGTGQTQEWQPGEWVPAEVAHWPAPPSADPETSDQPLS